MLFMGYDCVQRVHKSTWICSYMNHSPSITVKKRSMGESTNVENSDTHVYLRTKSSMKIAYFPLSGNWSFLDDAEPYFLHCHSIHWHASLNTPQNQILLGYCFCLLVLSIDFWIQPHHILFMALRVSLFFSSLYLTFWQSCKHFRFNIAATCTSPHWTWYTEFSQYISCKPQGQYCSHKEQTLRESWNCLVQPSTLLWGKQSIVALWQLMQSCFQHCDRM